MNNLKYHVLLCLSLLLTTKSGYALASAASSYSFKLESILAMAINKDPMLEESRYAEKALLAESMSSSSLQDPKASINFANFPVDDFSFNTQPMTQIKLGLSQTFGRGDSLELKRRVKELEAATEPYIRVNRKNQLVMRVGTIWLDAYKAQQSINLINSKKHLFNELSKVAEINYTSALNKSSQQDLIRAELELVKIEDQTTTYLDDLHTSLRQLSEFVELPLSYLASNQSDANKRYLSSDLPQIRLLKNRKMIHSHPLASVANQKISASKKMIELKKQDYKPQYTLNGSYGFRNNSPDGAERPDFFSIGVNFDLPLFAENRQDKAVEAAIYAREGARERKNLVVKQLTAAYQTELSHLNQLEDRLVLYKDKILPQVSQQGEASFNAYSNNEADFSELVRARIDQVNAQLKALDISVEIEKSKLKANYYLATSSEQMLDQIVEAEANESGEYNE